MDSNNHHPINQAQFYCIDYSGNDTENQSFYSYSMIVVGILLMVVSIYLFYESTKKREWIRQPMVTSKNFSQTYCYLSLTLITWVQIYLVIIIVGILDQIITFSVSSETYIKWNDQTNSMTQRGIQTLITFFTQIVASIIFYI